MPLEYTIGVHDPGHHLRVCVHIWRWNIAFGTYDGGDLLGKATGHSFYLFLRHVLGITLHTPFGPAIRNVNYSGLPRHPHV